MPRSVISEPPPSTALNNDAPEPPEAAKHDSSPTESKPYTSTLYPKIKKLADFIHAAKGLEEYQSLGAKILLKGSIKLHGTHADIVFDSPTSDEFRLQSRTNTELVPGKKDNAGFAGFVASLEKTTLLDLRDRIMKRYKEISRNKPVNGPVIIAGEWCGQGIQKKVAIAHIPKFFAIVSININNDWQPDWWYSDISVEHARIYHIGAGDFYELELQFDDVSASEAKIKQLTDKVEQSCPFARAIGKEGRGEGLVWKAIKHCEDPSFWFKSKGDLLAVSHVDKLPASAVDRDNRERIDNFARAVITEVRLEQGWEYLETKDSSGLGAFLKWVVYDCVTEEKREMDSLNISKGKLGPAIASVARSWFWDKLKEERSSNERIL